MTRSERRTFWFGHVESWQSTGESQAAYCRRYELSAVNFSYWKRCFERERLASAVGHVQPSSQAALVEVQVAEDERPHGGDSGITVAIGTDVRLQLSRDFDGAALRRAVEVLSDAGH